MSSNSHNILQYLDYKNKKNWISKLNEPLILRVQFIKSNSKNFDFYRNAKDHSFVEYILGHQELISPDELNKVKNNQTKNIQSNFNFLDYLNRDSTKQNFNQLDKKNLVWKYSNYYSYKNKEIFSSNKKAYRAKFELTNKNNIDDINSKTNIWSIVISERELINGELIFKNQHLIADRALRTLFDFPVNAVVSYHGNTDNPHIHIMAYQNTNVPRKNIINDAKINESKFKQSLKAINYLKFNNQKYWNEILQEKRLIKQSLNAEQIFYQFLSEFKELSINLNGKYEYFRLNKKQRLLVDNFFKQLINIDTNYGAINNFQKIFKNWNEKCENVLQTIIANISDENVRESIINQFEKLQKENELEIKNKLLKMIKLFDSKIQSSEFDDLNKHLKKQYKKNQLIKNLEEKILFYKKNNIPWKNKKALNIFKKIFLDDSNNINDLYSIANKNYNEFLKILNETNQLAKQKNYSYGER